MIHIKTETVSKRFTRSSGARLAASTRLYRFGKKIRRDSLGQATRIAALACLEQEINKSEENICQSTLYYYRGIRAKGTNWFIKSTRCSDKFMIPAGLYGNFPLVLLDSRWVKRRFPYRPSVSALQVARALGICK